MSTNLAEIESRLWSAADELRANSRLRASEYSTPVLGLIFLRYADHKFTQAEQEIGREAATSTRRRTDLKTQYQRCILSARKSAVSAPPEFTGG